jgi:hypothetical protein
MVLLRVRGLPGPARHCPHCLSSKQDALRDHGTASFVHLAIVLDKVCQNGYTDVGMTLTTSWLGSGSTTTAIRPPSANDSRHTTCRTQRQPPNYEPCCGGELDDAIRTRPRGGGAGAAPHSFHVVARQTYRSGIHHTVDSVRSRPTCCRGPASFPAGRSSVILPGRCDRTRGFVQDHTNDKATRQRVLPGLVCVWRPKPKLYVDFGLHTHTRPSSPFKSTAANNVIADASWKDSKIRSPVSPS